LSSAVQKALIKVDEKGTTAAAVTVMAIEATSGPPPPPPKPFEMICDKPFMFILYDYTYDGGNQVLFTGIVNQP
jgi:serpin B